MTTQPCRPRTSRVPRFQPHSFLALALALTACTSHNASDGTGAEAGAKDPVTIGYQGIVNPWKVAIHDKVFSKETGREILWRKFASGSEVITAMASGDVDLAVAGSSPIATATSSGLEVELIWILAGIREGEALVARKELGVKTIADLRGKTIAVPFASTTHYHLLVALKEAGIATKDLKILNLQPDAIMASWTQKHIDAAFVWSPVLDKLKESGTVVLTSGELADRGHPTFDGLLCDKAFGAKNAEFVAKVVAIIARTDAGYRNSKASWTVDSKPIKAISQFMGTPPKSCVSTLAQYKYLSLDEQLSEGWLGGGAAKALAQTATFLKQERKIRTVHDDYSQFVNPSFAKAAKAKKSSAGKAAEGKGS